MLDKLLFSYEGAKGLKTGSSIEAQFGFMGYVTIDNNDYISVLLGANTTTSRFTETTKL